jgi:uncharacterized protein YdeI (YjbR/CyaY-like superfamily)
LDVFNDFHPLIQFTSENEIDRRINFLDMALIRQDDKIISNYYSKTDSSNRILNLKSKHPFNMKLNTASSYAKRLKSLSLSNKSLNFGFKPYKKVSHMYMKTKLKDEDKAGVIYQLNCIGDQVLGQSCNKVYI